MKVFHFNEKMAGFHFALLFVVIADVFIAPFLSLGSMLIFSLIVGAIAAFVVMPAVKFIFKRHYDKEKDKCSREIANIPFLTGFFTVKSVITGKIDWTYLDVGVKSKEIISDDKIDSALQSVIDKIIKYRAEKNVPSKIIVYKVMPSELPRKIWKSDFIYILMPNSWETMLSYDGGIVAYKGFCIDVSVAPVVLARVAIIHDSIPIYLMTGSTYTLQHDYFSL